MNGRSRPQGPAPETPTKVTGRVYESTARLRVLAAQNNQAGPRWRWIAPTLRPPATATGAEARGPQQRGGLLQHQRGGLLQRPDAGDDLGRQIGLRRAASRRLPQLVDGRRDPLDLDGWPDPGLETRRATWRHLHDLGLMSEHLDRLLRSAA